MEASEKAWKTIVKPKKSPFSFDWKELWNYRDLCITLLKRNFSSRYKQTILSPIYFILAPIMASGVFSLVFGTVAGMSTDGCPLFLFYMAGNLVWNLFADLLMGNSDIFVKNSYIFSKVYFPRMIMPISNVLTKYIGLLLELVLFIIAYIGFLLMGADISPNILVLSLPVVFLMLTLLAIGCGLIISSMTIKYRDLGFVVSFALKIWMFLSPVIFPISSIEGWLKSVAQLNPVAPMIEIFRFAFFGKGTVEPLFVLISFCVSVIVFLMGVLLFNFVEKDFIDTV